MSENPEIASPRPTETGAFSKGLGVAGAFAAFLQPWPLLLIALAIAWFMFFNELRGEWEINAQYNYGYLVPLLGAALIWRRWPSRPKPAVSESQGLALAIAGSLFLLLLPMRLIIEANP